MDISKISSLFAQRKLNRRQMVQQGAAGLAAAGLTAAGINTASAQDGTPTADATYEAIDYLFVQSFESGSIAAKEGEGGAYTVTLQHGLGQTLYFSDRPERIVGTTPTGHFLDGLGFSDDNPPNAALVIGVGDGATDIAVVELTNPVYDVESATATYDISVLENFSDDGQPFQADPVDLAEIAAEFGAAHLFIDGCPRTYVGCTSRQDGSNHLLIHDHLPFCYTFDAACIPCNPYNGERECDTWYYYRDMCNADGAACPSGDCVPDFPLGYATTCS